MSVAETAAHIVRCLVQSDGQPVYSHTLMESAGLTQKQRRRTYTVLNVLEGIGCVRRTRRAHYAWLGWAPVLARIEKVKVRGVGCPPVAPHRARLAMEVDAADTLRALAQSGRDCFTLKLILRLLGWTTDTRVIYDILNVFCAVGLMHKRDRTYEWTPLRAGHTNWESVVPPPPSALFPALEPLEPFTVDGIDDVFY